MVQFMKQKQLQCLLKNTNTAAPNNLPNGFAFPNTKASYLYDMDLNIQEDALYAAFSFIIDTLKKPVALKYQSKPAFCVKGEV